MKRRVASLALLVLALLLLRAPANSQCVAATPPPDLNGTYVGNDRGTYYISQFGTDVWWVGMSPAGGKAFTNVFKGVRSGDVIVGNWADVGLGATHGHGSLHLLVTNNAVLRTIEMSGGFSGMTWHLYQAGCADNVQGVTPAPVHPI